MQLCSRCQQGLQSPGIPGDQVSQRLLMLLQWRLAIGMELSYRSLWIPQNMPHHYAAQGSMTFSMVSDLAQKEYLRRMGQKAQPFMILLGKSHGVSSTTLYPLS